MSTLGQNLQRQLDALGDCDRLFSEHFTGTKKDRPEFNKLLEVLRPGDTVKVESLSRLGRSMKDLIEIIDYFQENNINLISLKENIDLSTPVGRLCLNILASLSEFERETIVLRTMEGIKSAKLNGNKKFGRPKKDPRNINQAIRMYQAKSHSLKEIKDLTGVPPTTLYRYLSE